MSGTHLGEAGDYEPGGGYRSPLEPTDWRAVFRAGLICLVAGVIDRITGLSEVVHLPAWTGAVAIIAWGVVCIVLSHVISGPRAGNVFLGVLLVLLGASFFLWIP